MTKEEWELFIEVTLAVREMASPDRQRSIEAKLQALEDVERERAMQESYIPFDSRDWEPV